MDEVRIRGFPRQIPDGHQNRFPSLEVPGPVFGGKRISNNWNAKKGEPNIAFISQMCLHCVVYPSDILAQSVGSNFTLILLTPVHL